MTTRAEIEAFMAAQKSAVAPMNWREKLMKKDPQWSALFDYFCQKANLNVRSGFKSPPSTQLNLLLK